VEEIRSNQTTIAGIDLRPYPLLLETPPLKDRCDASLSTVLLRVARGSSAGLDVLLHLAEDIAGTITFEPRIIDLMADPYIAVDLDPALYSATFSPLEVPVTGKGNYTAHLELGFSSAVKPGFYDGAVTVSLREAGCSIGLAILLIEVV